MQDRAREIQEYADTNNMEAFFAAVKKVYGTPKSGSIPLLSKDSSTLLKDVNSINARWSDHFSELLNKQTVVDHSVFDELRQLPTHDHMADPPTMEELIKAINQIKNHKAAGADGIPAEVYKVRNKTLRDKLFALICRIWHEERLPTDLRDATIVTLFKKGNRSHCGNYRGISLLSTAGKILARLLQNRLSCSRTDPTQISVWLQAIQRYSRHDFLCKAAA